MRWTKAAVIGLVAGLVTLVGAALALQSPMAPINLPVAQALLLATVGEQSFPLAALLHLAYATLGSVIVVAIFGDRTTPAKGIGLALGFWLISMLVYSPIIGWGVFGMGGPNHELSPDAPLHIHTAGSYILLTFLLHLLYGAIVGWLAGTWMDGGALRQSAYEREQLSEASLRGQRRSDKSSR